MEKRIFGIRRLMVYPNQIERAVKNGLTVSDGVQRICDEIGIDTQRLFPSDREEQREFLYDRFVRIG
jgi:hypothetical protein